MRTNHRRGGGSLLHKERHVLYALPLRQQCCRATMLTADKAASWRGGVCGVLGAVWGDGDPFARPQHDRRNSPVQLLCTVNSSAQSPVAKESKKNVYRAKGDTVDGETTLLMVGSRSGSRRGTSSETRAAAKRRAATVASAVRHRPSNSQCVEAR